MSEALQTGSLHEETPLLSIVIPAYNEEERLPATVRRVEAYLEELGEPWELLVVDDGSSDSTVEVAEATFTSPRSRVLKNPRNLGKGASVKHGMLAARGEYRLFSDADLSAPIEELPKLLDAVRAEGSGRGEADVAIGSRALTDSEIEIHQPFYREMMGKVFNLIVQLLILPGIHDTQCGFKLFRREVVEKIFRQQELEGWAFDVELLILARKNGFKIVEVPVRWLNSPATRVMVLRDSLQMFLDVVRVWLRRGRAR